MNTQELEKLLEQNINEKGLKPYQIIRKLNNEQQKEVVKNLDNINNLTLDDKRKILATLKEEVKQSIDTTDLPKEYKTVLSMQAKKYEPGIILDLERELEDYRGLDDLIETCPEDFTEEQRAKFMKVCEICPNLRALSKLSTPFIPFYSSGAEYKEGEEWINSIIDSLNPEYSKAQKMAIIDNAIGKKISYSPDYGTEVFNVSDSRTIWKIINSGYGVCNGIASIEQYIFNRIGIESELISSGRHAFLKIKDIELPLANGEIAKGNTILDPTWNLTAHRFGGKPENFCVNYEQIRENDIDSEGRDHKCHENDEKLQDATIKMDEQSLRKLFASVGLADRNGQFPIVKLFEKSKSIHEVYANQQEQNLKEQFLLLQQTCPEFAKCQNSSIAILTDVLLNNENFKFDKCVVSRVYDKADKEKRPILFTYIDSDELENKFYFANNDTEGKFMGVTKEEFTNKFECYEKDLINGIRPWEISEQVKENVNLANSSGSVKIQEEQER